MTFSIDSDLFFKFKSLVKKYKLSSKVEELIQNYVASNEVKPTEVKPLEVT